MSTKGRPKPKTRVTKQGKTVASNERPRRSGKTYGAVDKSTAMIILDFLNGNIQQTARAIGVNVGTLREWRDELSCGEPNEAIAKNYQNGSERVANVLINLVEGLSIFALLKATSEDYQQLKIMIGIVSDKIEDIHKRVEAKELPPSLATHIPTNHIPTTHTSLGATSSGGSSVGKNAPPAIAPAPQPTEADLQWAREKEKYENMVKLILTEAVKEGTEVTREDAISSILKSKPEAAIYFEEDMNPGYQM